MLTIELSDHPGDLLSAATQRRVSAAAKENGQLASITKQRDEARARHRWLTWLRLAIKASRYRRTQLSVASRPTEDEEILKAGIAGEQRVARELGERLNDDWTLVHGYRNGRGEIDRELMGVPERAGTGVDVDHGHERTPIPWTMMVYIVEQLCKPA